MKEGYYANDPPKERRRDRGGEREEARDALPFARYRIVTRAFTRRTPPQDGRGADLCQSPEEESLKSILCEDTQPLSRSPHPREGRGREREREEARLVSFLERLRPSPLLPTEAAV